MDAISENGHVYSLAPNWRRAFHQHNFSGRLLSSREASTFTGFCGKHDAELFRPLDNQESDGSKRKAVLAVYRTLCRELFAKTGQIRAFDFGKELDRGRGVVQQLETQTLLSMAGTAARVALKELDDLKAKFDEAIIRDDQSAFTTANVFFEAEPFLLSCGGTNPTHDLAGLKVQDLADLSKPSEMVFLATLPSQQGLWASFVWDSKSKAAEQFVQNALSKKLRLGTIYAMCLVYIENTFLKPSAWNSLSKPDKAMISRLAWTGVADDAFGHVPAAVARLEMHFPNEASKII